MQWWGQWRVIWAIVICVAITFVAWGSIRQWNAPSGANVTLASADDPMHSFILPISVSRFSALPQGHKESEAVAELVTRELAGYLSRMGQLRVMAHGDISGANQHGPASKYAMSGSIHVHGETTGLDVQLVDLDTHSQVWWKSFERSSLEWPKVRHDILRQITFAVDKEILQREAARHQGVLADLSIPNLLSRGWVAMPGNTLNKYQEADVFFREVLLRDPENIAATIGLAGYKLQAALSPRTDRLTLIDEADDLLKRVISKSKRSSLIHFYLGLLYYLRDNLAASLEEYNNAIEMNPSAAGAYAFKGRALLRLGAHKEALESIRYAQLINGGYTRGAWSHWRGLVELELGLEDEAGSSFQKALAVHPDHAGVRATIASYYALRGDQRNARSHIAELRRLTPTLSDDERLTKLTRGPNGLPLQNRFGEGLRLALQLAR
jgi:tetratricopeptide (TPR) repeat protein